MSNFGKSRKEGFQWIFRTSTTCPYITFNYHSRRATNRTAVFRLNIKTVPSGFRGQVRKEPQAGTIASLAALCGSQQQIKVVDYGS